MTIEAFSSRMDTPGSRKFGTFSYLPPLTREQVLKQVSYMINNGWACAIEHVEPARATKSYWYMWKLPMFGEMNPETVMAEADACREANPGDHVRVIGYDHKRQTQGLALVVHRAEV